MIFVNHAIEEIEISTWRPLVKEITREERAKRVSKNTGFQVDHMAVIMVAHCSVKGQLVFKGNVFKVRPRG